MQGEMTGGRFDERLDDLLICPNCDAHITVWSVEDNRGNCPECGERVE